MRASSARARSVRANASPARLKITDEPTSHHQDARLVSPVTVADRIRWHEAEILELRRAQREALRAAIALVVGDGHAFSAKELFEHRIVSPTLATAFRDLGIRNAQQLGKKLKQIGLQRIGEDAAGVVWVV